MKLYEVPKNTYIKVLETLDVPPNALETSIFQKLKFHNLDGMYSYCTDENENVFHLKAWTEVDVVKEE